MLGTFFAPAVDAGGYFVDDDGNVHETAIDSIASVAISRGCNPPANDRFCPDDPVTRAEMASFLARALSLPQTSRDFFGDDDTSVHEADINSIAMAGITLGCNPPTNDSYCPQQPVSRAQMASFLTRALGLDPAPASEVEGVVRFVMDADSAFDVYTANPTTDQRSFMNEHYERMIVFSPYFDSRTAWYGDGLAYIDSYAIYVDETVHEEHPEWVLKDQTGEFLYIPWGCSGGVCPQYAADFGNPEFRQSIVDRITVLMANGYRGIWLDDVNMTWRVGDGTGTHVTPIDPRTGNAMTLSDWQRYMAEFTEEIRAAFPDIEISHNALWIADEPSRNPYIVRQISAANTYTFERGANDDGLRNGDGTFGFETFLAYTDYIHSLGTDVLFLDETHESLAGVEFGLAAYLLVSNGSDLLGHEDATYSSPDTWWTGLDVDLGTAEGGRYQWNGLIRRDFEKGFVLLNQPEAATITVNLGATYELLDGTTIDSVELEQRRGTVLLSPGA